MILAKAKAHFPDASVRKKRILDFGKERDRSPVPTNSDIPQTQPDPIEADNHVSAWASMNYE